MENVKVIEMSLQNCAHPEKIEHLQKFFKTAKGEYGEGDVFIGLNNPEVRAFAKEYQDISLEEVSKLLQNPIHEIRLLALLIMVRKYEKGNELTKEAVFKLYLDNTTFINNWDLVDLSAPEIIGKHLLKGDRTLLKKLSKRKLLWEQRISIVSTITLIRHNDFGETLQLVEYFLNHQHDLIHKACGWMLREVGKRDKNILSDFLLKHKNNMPRTMLRYAIEHYSEQERKEWLKR